MNILIAFDKFKDSMTATRACEAAEAGIRSGVEGKDLSIDVTHAPLTDGGEGFCRILVETAGGDIDYHAVTGPLGEEIDAPLGWVQSANIGAPARSMLGGLDGRIAVIEMAAVSGLEQVPFGLRHPRRTTTYGVGELLRIAAEGKADGILLGIGGSATSDLGLGALEALGLKFGSVGKITPAQWPDVTEIQGRIDVDLPPIYIACDVNNPLLGPNGAAAVYGPQKGLNPDEIEPFDEEARVLAKMLCSRFGTSDAIMDEPACGAAGGIGFGLKVASGADFVPGFELVEAWLDLKAKIEQADLLFTGEGKFDLSSLAGKGPYALLSEVHRSGKTSILLAGALPKEAKDELYQQFGEENIAHAISPSNLPLEDALERGPENLELASESAITEALSRL